MAENAGRAGGWGNEYGPEEEGTQQGGQRKKGKVLRRLLAAKKRLSSITVFDLWRPRRGRQKGGQHGDVIVVRFADDMWWDSTAADALKFQAATYRNGYAKVQPELHPEEDANSGSFGPYAIDQRSRSGVEKGKPGETVQFFPRLYAHSA